MTKKKISFKAAQELREVERQIDDWVSAPVKGSTPTQVNAEEKISRFTVEIPIYLHKRIKKTCAIDGVSMKDRIFKILLNAFPET